MRKSMDEQLGSITTEEGEASDGADQSTPSSPKKSKENKLNTVENRPSTKAKGKKRKLEHDEAKVRLSVSPHCFVLLKNLLTIEDWRCGNTVISPRCFRQTILFPSE